MSADVRTGSIGGIALPRVALAVLVLFLAANVANSIRFVPVALGFPYELDYGEGIVLQQMRNMLRGIGYSPLGVFPAIVYHYPPVYHMTVAGVAALFGLGDLVAGRVVSLLATAGAAVMVGWLANRVLADVATRAARITCGVMAGMILPSCFAVQQWAPLMRVDMLALFFDLVGVALAIGAVTRPRLIHAAALAFALALYSKQTSIAAPAATFGVLLAVRPALGLRGIATTAAIGFGALAVLSWLTDGGFLRHVLSYNINRFDLSRLRYLARVQATHIALTAVAAAGVVACVRRLRGADLRARAQDDAGAIGMMILLVYLAIATVMLAMLAKVGSNVNYVIEWTSLIAIFGAIGLRPLVAAAFDDGGSRAPVSLVLILLAGVLIPFQSGATPSWNTQRQTMAQKAKEYPAIVAMIRASSKPVIADPMTLLIAAGRDVEWEPAIAAELSHAGQYDEAAFVRMIRAGRFGFFALQGDPSNPLYGDRYDPAVQAAIAQAYPVQRQIGDVTLHLPAGMTVPTTMVEAGGRPPAE